MIKFFRRVRQKLLSQNKFSKYLLYAIGEIVLVVIGILIALQINNWNENTKLKQKELLLLKELKENLQNDLNDLNFNISNNGRLIYSNETIKEVLEQKIHYHDSLNFHFGNIFGNYLLTENTAAWENLKSVGLDLISNDSLRNGLSYLYSSKYRYIKDLEENFDNTYQWDYLYPQVLKHIILEELWVSGKPKNYDLLLKDETFLEVLKMNISARYYMQNQYKKTSKLVIDVLDQINEHTDYLND